MHNTELADLLTVGDEMSEFVPLQARDIAGYEVLLVRGQVGFALRALATLFVVQFLL